MAVRRLAPEALQPERFSFSPANQAAAREWIAKYPEGRQASAVIPLLMLAQEQEGWVTKAALEDVARMLDMPYIRVLEIATFYTQYHLAPVGSRAHVQVCGTTPCMLSGAGELIDVCRRKIHPEPHHLNEAGTLSWEEVECQGACVNAPMVMIFRDTYEDLTPERLEEIIDAFEAGQGDTITPGPQIDRMYSAPVGGKTTLLDEKSFTRAAPRNGDAGKAQGPQTPPSKAGRPVTFAMETAPGIDGPADGKSAKANGTPPAVGRREEPAAVRRKEEEPAAAPETEMARAGEAGTEEFRPPAMEKPEQPDDLTMISGIGRTLSQRLNSLGVYTFAQIAAWDEAQQAWIDSYMRFRGRVRREKWVEQASALARGGVEEYRRVFGRDPK